MKKKLSLLFSRIVRVIQILGTLVEFYDRTVAMREEIESIVSRIADAEIEFSDLKKQVEEEFQKETSSRVGELQKTFDERLEEVHKRLENLSLLLGG